MGPARIRTRRAALCPNAFPFALPARQALHEQILLERAERPRQARDPDIEDPQPGRRRGIEIAEVAGLADQPVQGRASSRPTAKTGAPMERPLAGEVDQNL
ncbi:hypothetical protein ACTJLD_04360 [Burkholderia sp. 22088]|uniref:hypothetical protein n=1 Tax=Burkholderia sp. 22088 TaxID=3453871 RepID=UPI003F82773A